MSMIEENHIIRPFQPPPNMGRSQAYRRRPHFDPSMPIDLELGCGTGMFALDRAKSHPERLLVAIERTSEKFRKFKRQWQGAQLENLWAIHGDAAHWVPENIPPECIENIFLLYPNPYPKKKQANLRWHNMPLMHVLLSKLKPRGTILCCSNQLWYIEEAKMTFEKAWGMKVSAIQHLTTENQSPRTLFEKKYLERGETVYQIICTKPS